MLNVLIIDDDLKDSKDVEKLCIHYFNKRNIDYKISVELKLNENLDTLYILVGTFFKFQSFISV